MFTQHLSWRWIFYINLPLGIAAFIVLGAVLHIPVHHRRRSIDWLGAGLLVASVTLLLLVTVWGGHQYSWTSPTILGLVARASWGCCSSSGRSVARRSRSWT